MSSAVCASLRAIHCVHFRAPTQIVALALAHSLWQSQEERNGCAHRCCAQHARRHRAHAVTHIVNVMNIACMQPMVYGSVISGRRFARAQARNCCVIIDPQCQQRVRAATDRLSGSATANVMRGAFVRNNNSIMDSMHVKLISGITHEHIRLHTIQCH